MSETVLPKFIEEHLERIAKENHFVDYSLEVKQGSKLGDGFMSNLFSITIMESKRNNNNNNNNKKMELVCKMAPLSKKSQEELISNVVFDREAAFYTEVMPIFVKFQEEKNLSKDDQFSAYPKCYGTTVDLENGHYAIIMEDLRPKNFKMWNKAKPSLIENVRLTMCEIGKFHGISIALKDQQPKEFAKFKKFTDKYFRSETVRDIYIKSYNQAIAYAKNEIHKNVMREIRQHFWDLLDDCLNEKSASYFGVICHGDLWNNNTLYKFNNNGVAEDIRILDWQALVHGSPAIDLLFNIFTSTDKALRDKEYDNLLKIYHNSLSNTVKLLGSNPDELFTFQNLKSEMERCGKFILLQGPLMMEISLAEPDDVAVNLNESFGETSEERKPLAFTSGLNEKALSEYATRLNDMIEDIIRFGYFNKN